MTDHVHLTREECLSFLLAGGYRSMTADARQRVYRNSLDCKQCGDLYEQVAAPFQEASLRNDDERAREECL